jgi:hypothetical protein
MFFMREQRPGDIAGRLNGKPIRVAFQGAVFFALFVGLLSCGPGDELPSDSGASQNFSAAANIPVETAQNQKVPIPSSPDVQPSPEIQQILSRHALYLSDLKYPVSGLEPQEQEKRSQREEYLNRILNEPDPETRQLLINWSKPILENDPEAVQIIKELKSYDGDHPDTDPFQSKGSLDSPEMNSTAGEAGG